MHVVFCLDAVVGRLDRTADVVAASLRRRFYGRTAVGAARLFGDWRHGRAAAASGRLFRRRTAGGPATGASRLFRRSVRRQPAATAGYIFRGCDDAAAAASGYIS